VDRTVLEELADLTAGGINRYLEIELPLDRRGGRAAPAGRLSP
jgi:hypothetical protein